MHPRNNNMTAEHMERERLAAAFMPLPVLVQRPRTCLPRHLLTVVRAVFRLGAFLVVFGILFVFASQFTVLGVERFPPPEFEEGYVMPQTTYPPARAVAWDYIDLAVLLGGLGVASWLSLVKRSRRAILYLTIAMVLYLGFWRKGCICPIGSIQSVSLALFDSSYAVPWIVLAFFLLPLVFALFFSRAFCAGVCPLGAIQDLFLIKPIKVPVALEQTLRLVPYLYLGLAILFAATGGAFIICEFDPFISIFRMSGSKVMLLTGAAFLLLGTVVGRPYCRFLCPYGALLSIVSRFSKWRVTLTGNECIRCQICDVACPYGAIREPNDYPASSFGFGKVAAIILLPLLVVLGIWLGNKAALALSTSHPTVRLAEQIAAEELKKTDTVTDSSLTWRQKGLPLQDLYADAAKVRRQFSVGSQWVGGLFGLVIGLKFISLSFPQRRSIFEPDPADCLSCGRCYVHCPKEIARVKRIDRNKSIPLTPSPK